MFAANGALAQPPVDTVDVQPSAYLDIRHNVSLVQLIANPEKYDGKKIQVIGFLQVQFEGNAVYLHEEDYRHGISSNGFWVSFSDKLRRHRKVGQYSNRYVILIGTFRADRRGHMGLFSGTLENIVRLDGWDLKLE
ncbi:hypothetical protein [Flaviaesturariibacter amylovorans]|uniref:Uncharacterized protein n=1 Tax=Flaviaesturariibacter amylovorans TaxID=1084520 RepID=A0ABP8G5F2_9BACT